MLFWYRCLMCEWAGKEYYNLKIRKKHRKIKHNYLICLQFSHFFITVRINKVRFLPSSSSSDFPVLRLFFSSSVIESKVFIFPGKIKRENCSEKGNQIKKKKKNPRFDWDLVIELDNWWLYVFDIDSRENRNEQNKVNPRNCVDFVFFFFGG